MKISRIFLIFCSVFVWTSVIFAANIPACGDAMSDYQSEPRNDHPYLAAEKKAFWVAVVSGKAAEVEQIYKKFGKDVSYCRDGYGNSPFMVAAILGHVEILKFFKSQGFTPIISDYRRKTSLHLLGKFNNVRIGEWLIEYGKEWHNLYGKTYPGVDMKDQYGVTPLQMAAHFGAYDYAKMLIKHGAKANQANAGKSILFDAIRSGNLNLVKLLVENGADPDKADKNGRTPRMLAADIVFDDIRDYFRKLPR